MKNRKINKSGAAPQGAVQPMTISLRAIEELVESRRKSTDKPPERSKPRKQAGPSEWILVFDTETAVDAAQHLRYGSYQIRKDDELFEEGLFYDPDAIAADEQAALRDYAAAHGLVLHTRASFVEDVFYFIGFFCRGTVVAFNLPFDISRLALDDTTAHSTAWDRSMAGGFSFGLVDDRKYPRIQVKHISRRISFVRFAALAKQYLPGAAIDKQRRGKPVKRPPTRRGFFIDVNTVASALLSERFKLDGLAKRLKTKHRKLGMEHHGGPIDSNAIEYARRDPQVTWECYVALRDKYASYNLTRTPLHKVFSEASVGKAHLREMNIAPLLQVQPDFPREMQGRIMSTLYGGRSEVGIRRQMTQVFLCDFLSMYPTVCVMQNLWPFFIASGVTWREDAQWVRVFLERTTLADLQRSETWRELVAIVEVMPNDDAFPIRAKYGTGNETTIGLNYASSHKLLVYTLADCVTSKLITGKAPKVVRAWIFSSKEPQEGLQPVNIAGNVEYSIDPYKDDFFRRLIERREEVKTELNAAEHDAAQANEVAALEAEQVALKIVANSTSYGMNGQLNEELLPRPHKAQCYPHSGRPYPIDVDKHEAPGDFFNPLLATVIPAAARLMLTIAEILGASEGLGWAFCDTDSIALAKSEEMGDDTFFEKCRRVLNWFSPLNPYSFGGPILKIEKQNYALKDGKPTNSLAPLFCYAVSAKRYVLLNLNEMRRPVLRKCSAHGLGYLMDPYGEDQAPPSIPKPAVSLGKIGAKRWQYDVWYRIAEAALDGHADCPDYSGLPNFDQPAITQDTVTTPNKRAWFDAHNAERPYHEQTRPFGFLLALHVQRGISANALVDATGRKPLGLPNAPRPISPFTRDPVEAARTCVDRDTGQPVAPERLKTYRQALQRYHLHPESKFLNGDYFDRGLTTRRHIFASHVQNTGKEANHADDQTLYGIDEEAVAEYEVAKRTYKGLQKKISAALDAHNKEALAKAAGVSARHLSNIVNKKARPKAATFAKLLAAIAAINDASKRRNAESRLLLKQLHEQAERAGGWRALALRLGVDRANLKAMRDGKRPISASVHQTLRKLARITATQ